MIHNRDELKECRQKAKADMETAACRILVCSGTAVSQPVLKKYTICFLKTCKYNTGRERNLCTAR